MLYEGTGNSTVGHPPAQLDAGPATITVSMDGVYSAANLLHRADRNLDLVMLTSNLTDLRKRVVNDTQGPLSLDGLISQHGELFMRAKNTGERDLTLVVPRTAASSPDDYQQPIRFPIPSPTDPNTMVSGCTHQGAGGPCKGCRCPRVSLPAIDQGDWSLWQEVGSLMDTFMPGVWTIYSKCSRSLCVFFLRSSLKEAAAQMRPCRARRARRSTRAASASPSSSASAAPPRRRRLRSTRISGRATGSR